MKTTVISIACVAACISFFFFYLETPHHEEKLQVLPIAGASGPESFAFDGNGEGPYTGVSDGRIFKWSSQLNQWTDFAAPSLYILDATVKLLPCDSEVMASSKIRYEECAGSQDTEKEHVCGRPLGLQFNEKTGDLFVADAYKGLLKAERDERVLKPVVTRADGGPLCFTNGLDIDQDTGVIYFTDSSMNYQRRQFMEAIITGDRTGRVMKYDPRSGDVEVLIHGLAFPNGVALSKDGGFILIVETTTSRILKYKLKEKRVEVLVRLPGFPDNIKRCPRGGYWVAMHSRRRRVVQWALSNAWVKTLLSWLPFDLHRLSEFLEKWRGGGALAMRIGEEGEVLEVLEERLKFISEVHERNGSLWIGSVVMPFVSIYQL